MTLARHVLSVVLLAVVLVTPAMGAERTVTLAVDNMTCSSCPYIVEKALTRVPGVSSAEVSFEDKTATVTFDDARTGVDALTRATADAGYPSTVGN